MTQTVSHPSRSGRVAEQRGGMFARPMIGMVFMAIGTGFIAAAVAAHWPVRAG
jgi:hypothetical protein